MTLDLSLNLATVRKQWSLREAVEACARHGIRAVDPWRDQVAATGVAEAARIMRDNGMRVTGLCRGGMFPAADADGRERGNSQWEASLSSMRCSKRRSCVCSRNMG